MPTRPLSRESRVRNLETAHANVVAALRIGPLHVVTADVTRNGTHFLAVYGIYDDARSGQTHQIRNLTWHVGIMCGMRVVDRAGTWHIASIGYGFSRKTEIAETIASVLRAHYGNDVPAWLVPILAAPQSHVVSGAGW